MSDKDHEEDEMKVVYHEDMQAGKCFGLYHERGRLPPTIVAQVQFMDQASLIMGSYPCSKGFPPGSLVFVPPQSLSI